MRCKSAFRNWYASGSKAVPVHIFDSTPKRPVEDDDEDDKILANLMDLPG